MNEETVRVFYGSGKTYIDVTAQALAKCAADGYILIPRGDTGSEFFPDPLPGFLKNIIVLRQQDGAITLESYGANEEVWVPLRTDDQLRMDPDRVRLQRNLHGSGLSLDVDYDLLIYCEQASHWQNVARVTEQFITENPDLNVGLIASYHASNYAEARYPVNLPFKDGIPLDAVRLFRAKVMLTPYVGLPSNLRPTGSKVVHALVSFASLEGVYARYMFDGYDYILCAGPHHIKEFTEWAESRPELKGKVLLSAGYPKLDLVMEWFSSEKSRSRAKQLTVLYAPTHVYFENERFCSLRDYGDEIVAGLLKAGHRVIFRPHPNSFEDADANLVDQIRELHALNPNFQFDTSKEYRNSFSAADLIVTDLSGTGFTFSLATGRPALFFAPNPEVEVGLTGIQFTDRELIGGVARNVPELLRLIETMDFSGMATRIADYRNKVLFNPATSAGYVARAIRWILRGEACPESVVL